MFLVLIAGDVIAIGSGNNSSLEAEEQEEISYRMMISC
jgi:hypothetical protein